MKRLTAASALVLLASGCSIMAPGYTPTVQTNQALKGGSYTKVSVGNVATANNEVAQIGLRGTSLKSPYGGFDKYLEQALRQELEMAGLLSDDSGTTLSAVLTRNEVDAAVSAGRANLAAHFTLMRGAQVVYGKELSVTHEWESSFAGAVAIPNAANAYPEVVNKLVTALLTDAEFKSELAK